MKIDPDNKADLSAQIAEAIRDAIVSGQLIVDERLPSEAELADHFAVSRPTVREALKRLAAQSLIRTQRGAFGGAFVNRLSYPEAYGQQITTATLLLSMNAISFDVACEAPDTLATMRAEIHRQGQPGLTDESFCASDVAFHRALVDSAGNPVLSYQLAGAVEAMQPLMNMITFTARSREAIVGFHTRIADALSSSDAEAAQTALTELEAYTLTLGRDVMAARAPK